VYKGDPAPPQAEEAPQSDVPQPPSQIAEEPLSSAESSWAIASSSTNNNTSGESSLPKPIPPDHVGLSHGVIQHFHDATLKADLGRSVDTDSSSDQASHARSLNGFFTVLALCHTVLAVIDPETNTVVYKAQSPDEAALVQAAADMGFVFCGRDRETLNLRTPFSEEMERYELLNILEFTSARKRMSVVLRKMDDKDGRLFLLTKGADSVIFERLKPGGDELKEITERQLTEFASEGLRTLTLAYKVISGECSLPHGCTWIFNAFYT
jgi:phospholipid-translocating ATPase